MKCVINCPANKCNLVLVKTKVIDILDSFDDMFEYEIKFYFTAMYARHTSETFSWCNTCGKGLMLPNNESYCNECGADQIVDMRSVFEVKHDSKARNPEIDITRGNIISYYKNYFRRCYTCKNLINRLKRSQEKICK